MKEWRFMGKKYISGIIRRLEDWVNNVEKKINYEIITDLKTTIIRSMYKQDYEELCLFRSKLTPVTSKLRDIAKNSKDLSINKTSEQISTLNSMVHGILFILEKDDVVSAVNLISYGREVMIAILTKYDGANTLIFFPSIRDHLGLEVKNDNEILGVLGALQEIGCISIKTFNNDHSLKSRDDYQILLLQKGFQYFI